MGSFSFGFSTTVVDESSALLSSVLEPSFTSPSLFSTGFTSYYSSVVAGVVSASPAPYWLLSSVFDYSSYEVVD